MKKYLKEDWPLYLIFLVIAIVIARGIATNTNKPQEIKFEENHLILAYFDG